MLKKKDGRYNHAFTPIDTPLRSEIDSWIKNKQLQKPEQWMHWLQIGYENAVKRGLTPEMFTKVSQLPFDKLHIERREVDLELNLRTGEYIELSKKYSV